MYLSYRKIKRAIINSSLVIVCFASASTLQAAIELPRLISPGAIMQRDQVLPVWGSAEANVEITVTLGTEKRNTQSDGNGHWRVEFDAQKAGGPHSIKIEAGSEKRLLTGIYFGDVWVASGQSNMEWVLRNSDDADTEIAGKEYPLIKHFKVPRTFSALPETTLAGGNWMAATAQNKPEFSAVAYFFAKQVHEKTGVPIGIIGSNWGGSNIESWMSPEILNKTQSETAGFIQNIESESKRQTLELKKTLQAWSGSVSSDMASAKAYWQGVDLDTSDWLPLHAPQLWESQGYPGMDGVAWYRKTIELSEEQAAGDAVLSLARIDDNDITYINGEKVGETRAYDVSRSYSIPEGILKAGKNTIAIRVEDTGGGGGIYSSDDMLFLKAANGEQLSLAGEWLFKADKVSVSAVAQMNHVETALYNKMMHPLFRFPVKGVLWYQGESNANTLEQAENYAQQFKALIQDWRKRWKQEAMPFYWVQLANFNSGRNTPEASPWAVVRESQTSALDLKNTGHAITIDVGDANDIHPRDKKTVGTRLASIALNRLYGMEETRFRGPVFNTASYAKSKVIVHFSTFAPLEKRGDSNNVIGFELAAKDGVFQKVEGKISADSKIALKWNGKDKPVSIRYAWDDNPEDANLMDKSGLPAEPFRGKF